MKDRAGDPTLGELSKISKSADFPVGFRALTKSTISDVLNHKRTRMPSWGWVAGYVTACRIHARRTGLDPDALGLGSLSEWRERFQDAKHASAATNPLPVKGDARRSPGPTTGAVLPPGAGPEAIGADDEPDLADRGWYLERYGRTGGRLHRRAMDGDPESAYQLAVLLICECRDRVAGEWLAAARQGGHTEAAALARADRPRERATAAAYAIGQRFDRVGQQSAAMIFYRRAVRNRHAASAYRLGEIHVQQRELWDAAYWFERSGRYGHVSARRRFEELNALLCSDVALIMSALEDDTPHDDTHD